MRGSARIRRSLRRARGRMGRPGNTPAPAAVLGDNLLDPFRHHGVPDPEALREAFRCFHDEEELSRISRRQEADLGLKDLARGIAAGSLPFFDHHLEASLSDIDWFAVPGGGRWIPMPARSYDHSDFTRWGDVRQLWELGRLQAAPTLLAAARLDEGDEWRDLALAHLADFRRRNPLGWGPQWIAGLEAALRVFSLLWSWALHEKAEDEDTLLLAASLLENGRFVEGRLSLKEIANNHLIGEAAALFCLGCALPTFTDSARWRDRGFTLLDRELQAQVLPDGVQGEQALEYHRFVLEFYLQALLWGEPAGEDLKARWWRTLQTMFRPLRAMTGPDGFLVSLGDDDGGRILRLDRRHRRDARGLLALGSRLLELKDLGLPSLALEGEALWLLGTSQAEQPIDPGRPPDCERFGEAGWFVSRFGETVPETGLPSGHLFFRAGAMGRGGAGHSHADQLSLTLSLNGHPVLVDPGTYLYNGPQPWRDYFRGAAAHSLLRVGGRDPARLLPPPDRFGWAEKSEAVTEFALTGAVCRYWQARRQGDRDAAGAPLTVFRRLLQIPPGLILILDEFEATGDEALPVELLWQCAAGVEPHWHPAAETEIEGPQGRGSGGHSRVSDMAFHALRLKREERSVLLAHFFAPGGLFPFMRRGESRPPAGWVSPDYGRKIASAQTGLAGRTEGPLLLASLLADPQSYPRMERSALSRSPGGDFRLEISRELDEDLRISFRRAGEPAQAIEDWVEDLEISASLALAVMAPQGRLAALAALSPGRLRYRGRDLLDEKDMEPLFEKEW